MYNTYLMYVIIIFQKNRFQNVQMNNKKILKFSADYIEILIINFKLLSTLQKLFNRL